MKVLYIIGKYTDVDKSKIITNILLAVNRGKVLAKDRWAVITPHTNFLGHEEVVGYKGVMKQCFALIKMSDAVYVLNNWKNSKGSKKEVALAKKLKKRIIYQVKNELGEL